MWIQNAKVRIAVGEPPHKDNGRSSAEAAGRSCVVDTVLLSEGGAQLHPSARATLAKERVWCAR